MKRIKWICLLCCLCLLTGCAAPVPPLKATATLVPGTKPQLPEAAAPADQVTQKEALLYFRYGSEPYLAAENRLITHSPSEPYELALTAALLSGPTPQRTELGTLFPDGTQVLSTSRQGRTLFVTLSKEIMNAYPDEPSGWRNDPFWAQEVPLRRRLCMQSLAATLTENCDIDRVQVLVEQSSGEMTSLRLKALYFLATRDEALLAPPLTRDESLLLTPGNTLKVILDLWQQQDWQRLYDYLAASDPVTGADRCTYADFVTAMENLPRLTQSAFTGGSISADGRWAAYTLSANLLAADHQPEQYDGKTLRLLRENGLWKVTLAQLTDWLEVGR